jgi:hypothetical protein
MGIRRRLAEIDKDAAKSRARDRRGCMVIHTAMTERRTRYYGPTTGEDSATVLDEAIVALAGVRDMGMWIGDASTELHMLTSLIKEAESRLPRAVAEARDQEYSWAEIADLLGVTRASAWQRYAARSDKNRTPVED